MRIKKLHTYMKKIYEISLIKTVRFNLHYFGIQSLLAPKVIVARNVLIDQLGGAVIIGNGKVGTVRLGFRYNGNVDVKYSRLIWRNSGTIEFKGECRIGAGGCVSNEGELIFGPNFHCTGRSEIICKKKISFGKDTLLSWDTLIMDSDYHRISNLVSKKQVNPDREITIGDNCWIGCRCLLLKGTVIGNNIIVSAGTKVSGNNLNEEFSIIGLKNYEVRCLKRNVIRDDA